MMKSGTTFGLPVLVLGSASGLTAFAQTTTPTQTTPDQTAASSTSQPNPNDTRPTRPASHFRTSRRRALGQMNPFARKKWVNRQTPPLPPSPPPPPPPLPSSSPSPPPPLLSVLPPSPCSSPLSLPIPRSAPSLPHSPPPLSFSFLSFPSCCPNHLLPFSLSPLIPPPPPPLPPTFFSLCFLAHRLPPTPSSRPTPPSSLFLPLPIPSSARLLASVPFCSAVRRASPSTAAAACSLVAPSVCRCRLASFHVCLSLCCCGNSPFRPCVPSLSPLRILSLLRNVPALS